MVQRTQPKPGGITAEYAEYAEDKESRFPVKGGLQTTAFGAVDHSDHYCHEFARFLFHRQV